MLPGTANLKDPPDLAARIAAARARYDALPPIEKAIHDMEQRRSGIIGMSKLSTPREQIEAHIDAMPEYIVLAELKRLRAEGDGG